MSTMMKTTGKMPVPPKMKNTGGTPVPPKMKDSELKGGFDSVREPVVGVIKRPKARGKMKGNGQDARSTRDGDPLQVKRVPKPKITRGEHWNDNNQVYLTGLDFNTQGPAALRAGAFKAFLDSLIPTADPLDRAHNHRRLAYDEAPKQIDESWVLLSHQEIDHPLSKIGRRTGKPKKTTRRRYHPTQLASSGVSFDSMHDAGYEIAKGFQGAGINLGWDVQTNREAPRNEHDRALALAGLGRNEAKAILEPKTSHKLTTEERKLEAAGSAILNQNR